MSSLTRNRYAKYIELSGRHVNTRPLLAWPPIDKRHVQDCARLSKASFVLMLVAMRRWIYGEESIVNAWNRVLGRFIIWMWWLMQARVEAQLSTRRGSFCARIPASAAEPRRVHSALLEIHNRIFCNLLSVFTCLQYSPDTTRP